MINFLCWNSNLGVEGVCLLALRLQICITTPMIYDNIFNFRRLLDEEDSFLMLVSTPVLENSYRVELYNEP